MSFESCLSLLSLQDKLPVGEIRETAKEYAAEGMDPAKAMERAVAEHLAEAKREEAHIVATVREKYQAAGGNLAEPKAEAPKQEPVAGGVTDTPAFRKWFGASKVVDESGKPRVMYHGTGKDFNEFSPTAGQDGRDAIFLTDDPTFADQYAGGEWTLTLGGRPSIMPVYVKAERPFDYDNAKDRAALLDVVFSSSKVRRAKDGTGEMTVERDGAPSLYTRSVLDSGLTEENNWTLIEQGWMQGALRDAGFDGFYVAEAGRKNLAVYRPDQVKSATGNSGAFDMANPDIRYSVAHPMASDAARGVDPVIKALADKGAIVLHADASTLPVKGKAPAGVQALTTADGTIHVVANALGDNARGIILHEAFHAGTKALIGSSAWDGLNTRLGALYRQGERSSGAAREFWDAARDRVETARAKGAVAPGMEHEEFGAYAIEEYAKAPTTVRKWVDDLVGAVKAWALRRFGKQLGDVTPAQLSSLAKLALLDAQGVRSASAQSERRNNALEKFLDGSHVKDPVFHGTTTDITAFEQPVRHLGGDDLQPQGVHFFAKEPAVANGFARSRQKLTGGDPSVHKVHISLRNPIDLRDMGVVRKVLEAADIAAPARMGEYDAYALLDNPKVMSYLRSSGYDGALLRERGHPFAAFRKAHDIGSTSDQVGDFSHMREHPAETYAVFSPHQIKSATGNNGNFDANNPDIRYAADSSQTIEVDGQRRPIERSDGKLIAEDMHKQLNFWRWFNASKAVDEKGRPLVVYHGSPDLRFMEQDGTFKSQREKLGFGRDEAAHWFAASPATAKSYADPHRAFDYQNSEPGVIPAFLKMENPLIVDGGGQKWRDAQKSGKTSDVIREARDGGHDGVIIRNVRDNYQTGVVKGDRATDTYVVFSSKQIKSADKNSGDFGDTPDIRYSVAGSPPAATWEEPRMSQAQDVVQALQDQQLDTKQIVKAVRGAIGELDDKWDPYLQEELYHGRTATGYKDFLHDELRPLLDDMRARGIGMEEFETFLHMRHAEEANAQVARINSEMPDKGSGVATQDALDYLAALPPAKARAYAALAARVDAMVQKTRSLLVDYGLEKQSMIDSWAGAYQHYVPLQRQDMDGPMQGGGTGSGFSIRGAASKRRMGSERDVVNIIANIAQARERTIVRGEKNRVGLAVYGLSLQAPNPSFWKPINPRKNPAQLKAELESMGLPPELVNNLSDPPTERVVMRKAGASPDQFDLMPDLPRPGHEVVVRRIARILADKPNVLAVRVDGEDRFLIFNEKNERALRMAMSLKNVGIDTLGWLTAKAGWVTRQWAAMNTQYNPIFGLVNLTRDTSEGQINLSSTPIAGRQPAVLAEATRLFYKIVKTGFNLEKLTGADAALWSEFQQIGGITGFRAVFNTGDDRNLELHKEIRRLGGGWTRKAWDTVFDWLSNYNEALENVTRLAAYKVAKENGLTQQRAASLAKNLTTNFNRHGSKTQQVRALYAFFNAAIQGSARIIQTVRGPAGKKIVAGGLMIGVLQTVMLAAAGFDDDDIPEFVKSKNLILPIPGGKDKDYFTIPYPLGFSFLPTIGRLGAEFAKGGAKHPGRYGAHALAAMLDTFNPLGGSRLTSVITPTVGDPIIDLATNTDWTGKKIAREDMSSLDPTPGHTRAKDTASAFGHGFSRLANAATGGTDYTPGAWSPTPDQVDYFIGQLTGGVGRESLKAQQTVSALISGESLPAHKIPLIGRFYGQSEGKSSIGERFYENVIEVNRHASEVEGRRKDKKEYQSYLGEYPEARLDKMARDTLSEISDLRKHRRELVAKGGERDKVQDLEAKISKSMSRFNERVKLERSKVKEVE